jgi:hypothetical protein
MFTDERPEHARYTLQLPQIKAPHLHQPESALHLNHFHPPLTPKISHIDGQKLHPVMVTPFSGVITQITTTISSVENIKIKQVL